MTVAKLEHANITVTDPAATAAWMEDVFGWSIRWQGESKDNGHSIHVGEADTYIALYHPAERITDRPISYGTRGGLNHLAVTVDDLKAIEKRVIDAGFEPGEHYDYEPGERFYFYDNDGIEYEVVSYA
ncbi:MAG: VOC family protein [Pseudomonadota bacterium]